MRTTVTLEVNVAARLREFSHGAGKTFKQAVNDAVRQAKGCRHRQWCGLSRSFSPPTRWAGCGSI